MPNDFNQQVIDEFRANGGRVGGPFEGGRLLLLTTTGARSGTPHTTPLGYLPDGGERVLVIASAGGSPTHPHWFRNLVADPQVTVEDGVFTYPARATVLAGAERDDAFARAVEAEPGWAEYESRSGRTLPVVALESVAQGPPDFASLGEALIALHGAFRRELALIRKEVTASGPGLGAQLRVNCLTLCQGLSIHHTGEDAGIFPFLAGRHPELSQVLARLELEHQKLKVILDDLKAVLAVPDSDPAMLLVEVERLTERLEDHLRYEEEQLLPFLN